MVQTKFGFPLVKHTGILLVLIALLAGVFAGTVYLFQLPIASSSLDILSNYTHRGTYTYDVYLLPNRLFTDAVIHGEPGGHYFTNITDRIDVTFTYHFLCEPPANVTGTLETNATLSSVASRDGAVLWSKDLVTLLPAVHLFQGSEISVQLPFDLDALYTLIDQIEHEIRVYSSEYQVTFSASLHTVAETDVGVIDETFHATMRIHLSDTVITIDSGLTREQPGTIEHVTTLSFPWVNNWRVGAILILGVLTVVTGYYIPIYRRTAMHRSAENLVKKILKKYDDLIIYTTQTTPRPQASAKTVITVEAIEDLHKIAEQTSKPIVYTANPPQQLAASAAHLFFIQDVDTIYTLRIEETLPDPSGCAQNTPAVPLPDSGALPKIQRGIATLRPLVGVAGVLVVGAILWLTWYEGIGLNRDLSTILLGPRSLFFDLGIGLRIIHYLGMGLGCCAVGSWQLVKTRVLVRWLAATNAK
jgi:hypothetical protein